MTGSFMDYGMPRADDIPNVTSDYSLVPTKTNLLGVKGGSEAGNVGAPPAIVNAIVDALSDFGIDDVPLPATAEPSAVVQWTVTGKSQALDRRTVNVMGVVPLVPSCWEA